MMPSRITEADVSSHDDSIPNIVTGFIYFSDKKGMIIVNI